MILLPLLLASLASAQEAASRLARAHELRGRLGAAPPVAPSPDLRTRILTWFRAHEVTLVRHLGGTDDFRWVSDAFQALYGAGFPYEVANVEHPYDLWLPRHGLRTPLDFAVDWMGRTILAYTSVNAYLGDFGREAEGIRDWVEAVHPDLLALSFTEAKEASRIWHAQFLSAGFGAPAPEALVVLRWPDGATLQRLLTKKDFASEGTSMGHCVGGVRDEQGLARGESRYFQSSRDGEVAILSYRNPQGVPQATIEVIPRTFVVIQVQGPKNDPVKDAMVRARLAAWGDDLGLPGDSFLSLGDTTLLVSNFEELANVLLGAEEWVQRESLEFQRQVSVIPRVSSQALREASNQFWTQVDAFVHRGLALVLRLGRPLKPTKWPPLVDEKDPRRPRIGEAWTVWDATVAGQEHVITYDLWPEGEDRFPWQVLRGSTSDTLVPEAGFPTLLGLLRTIYPTQKAWLEQQGLPTDLEGVEVFPGRTGLELRASLLPTRTLEDKLWRAR